MKTSAGAPASICFASALLAAVRDDDLVARFGFEPADLLVQRFLEAGGGEDGEIGAARRQPCDAANPSATMSVAA